MWMLLLLFFFFLSAALLRRFSSFHFNLQPSSPKPKRKEKQKRNNFSFDFLFFFALFFFWCGPHAIDILNESRDRAGARWSRGCRRPITDPLLPLKTHRPARWFIYLFLFFSFLALVRLCFGRVSSFIFTPRPNNPPTHQPTNPPTHQTTPRALTPKLNHDRLLVGFTFRIGNLDGFHCITVLYRVLLGSIGFYQVFIGFP